MAIGYIVVLMPIVVVFFASFSDGNTFRFPPSGFSLKWYQAAFESSEYRNALSVSLLVGILATLVSLTAGTLAAYALSRSTFRGKTMIETLLLAPLALPHIVWAIGLLQIYAWLSIGGTLLGLVLAHAALTLPFAVRIMLSTFSQLDKTLQDAATTLGASPMRVVVHIVLPLIWPGVLTSALFTFLTSFNEVTVSVLIAGSRYLTYPVRLYSELRSQGIDPTTIAISAMLVAMIIVFALIGERFLNWSRRV
ncbi:ABC transporter permease [Devosia pacifica]|nr:ABC transporter permease [Devosia pacifica]